MVDVSNKDVTVREVTAQGYLYVDSAVISQISEEKIAKGDVFAVARIAGIQGAKRCSDLIPLCHPLAITGCDVGFQPADDDHQQVVEHRFHFERSAQNQACGLQRGQLVQQVRHLAAGLL